MFPYNNPHVYFTDKIERFDKIFKRNNISKELSQQFYNTFNPDSEEPTYPIHLDYKISNNFGSYPNIYLRCRDIPIKNFMKETEDYFKLLNNNA